MAMDPVNCYCRKRSRLNTSWIDNNPRRRFLGYPDYRRFGACGFFLWVDPPLCSRCWDVIPRLLRRTKVLEEELRLRRTKERWLIACLVISWVILFWCNLRSGGESGNIDGNGINGSGNV